MYRSAAKRLLQSPAIYRNARSQFGRTTPSINPTLALFKSSPYFSTTATTDSLLNRNPNNPFTASSSSTTSSGSTEEEKARGYDSQCSRGTKPRAHYEDKQPHVLNASFRHMVRLGWTEAAMIAGAREISVFPSIVGSFPQKEAALIEELGVCFAFVEFEDVESVQNAIKASPIQLAGRQVYIEERKPSSSSYSNISRGGSLFQCT